MYLSASEIACLKEQKGHVPYSDAVDAGCGHSKAFNEIFGNKGKFHHSNHSGVQETNEEKSFNKNVKNQCLRAFQGCNGEQLQQYVSDKVMWQLDVAAKFSADPDRAQEVAIETQELIKESPEMARQIDELSSTVLRNDDGVIMMTKADRHVYNEKHQMSHTQLSQEEINAGVSTGKGAELIQSQSQFKSFGDMLGLEKPVSGPMSTIDTPEKTNALNTLGL